MNGPHTVRATSVAAPWSTRPRSLRIIAAAAVAAAGSLLVGVVAVDGSEPPSAPVAARSDDSIYRQLVNEGQVPRPFQDAESNVTRRLVNRGLVPHAALE